MTSPARNLTFWESITTTSVRETSTTSHFASASPKSNQSPSPQSSPCSPPPHTGAGSQSGHSTRPDSGHLNPSWLVMSALQVRRTKTFSSVATGIALSPSRTTRTTQGPPTGNNPVMPRARRPRTTCPAGPTKDRGVLGRGPYRAADVLRRGAPLLPPSLLSAGGARIAGVTSAGGGGSAVLIADRPSRTVLSSAR